MPARQSANAVLMVRPARFQTNALTAPSNAFQREASTPSEESQRLALAEFEGLREVLEEAGVQVVVVEDTPEPQTPDAVFPNNWVSFHADGTVVLFPMQATNRRSERRVDVLDALASDHGFVVRRVVDLSGYEERELFLEGTGSLVLDRVNQTAFACLSPRTHLEPLADFGEQLGYEVVTFQAFDRDHVPIYHTNVMMWVGARLAAVCIDVAPQHDERDALLKRLRAGGREVLDLDVEQVLAFAGNMLELETISGERLLVMSDHARRSLRHEQSRMIERHSRIVSVSLDHIERVGGGGVRCMLAAIHLPQK